MKKIGIVLMILMMGYCTSEIRAQKKPILDGIFDLRLGMSKQELFAVIDTTEIRDCTYEDLDGTDYVNRVEKIRIQQYTPIIDGEKHLGYDLNSISITFLNDKAFRIYLFDGNNVLEEMMIKKYGKPKKRGKRKTKTEIEYKPYAERTSEFDEVKDITVTTISDTRRKIWKTGDKNIECESYPSDLNEESYQIVDKAMGNEISKRRDIWWENHFKKYDDLEEKRKQKDQKAYDAL